MIEGIAGFLSVILSHIYNIVPNFGIAIILLTLLVKLVTFPLNNKQIRSSKRMQELQPEIKKIQQKYKNDKEKQNKAVMEFMKENNMNPLAGCLPMLVQLPILIGMFTLLRQTDKFILDPDKAGYIEGFDSFLFQSAKAIDLVAIPSFDLANISVLWLFPILAGLTTYTYQKQMMTDQSQKMLMYLMPVMIVVFSFSFPVGLTLYWIMNNVISMGQHHLIKHMDKQKESPSPEPSSKQKPGQNKNEPSSKQKSGHKKKKKETGRDNKSDDMGYLLPEHSRCIACKGERRATSAIKIPNFLLVFKDARFFKELSQAEKEAIIKFANYVKHPQEEQPEGTYHLKDTAGLARVVGSETEAVFLCEFHEKEWSKGLNSL